MQFPASTGKVPQANFPNWEAFTTNTAEYAFDVNEYIDLQANELPHCWEEGTSVEVHVHLANKTAQATGADRFIKFEAYVAYADHEEAWIEHASSPVSGEWTIATGTAALTHHTLSLGYLTMPDNSIGTQVKIRIKRIAATGGTEYADRVFVTQCGVHHEVDALGSATISRKEPT